MKISTYVSFSRDFGEVVKNLLCSGLYRALLFIINGAVVALNRWKTEAKRGKT